MKRKTPLKRKTALKVKNSRPMRRAKPSVAAAQYLQRKALAIRSGGRCEMEYRVEGRKWARCGNRATDPAHIYTRPKCGAARDLLAAVIHACRLCHERSKGRLATDLTRIPFRYAEGAWDVILTHSRLGVDAEDRLRIHIGSVGPRPEKGVPPYVS